MRTNTIATGMGASLCLLLGCGDAKDGRANGGTDSAGIPAGGEAGGGEQGGEGGDAEGSGDGPVDGDGEGDGVGAIKFDVNATPDIDPTTTCQPGGVGGGKGGGGGGPDYSYLWAANSTQGTISKLDTQTVTEVGRFQVRPDGAGSPSRTSVSLSGHVAVASRSGGVTKFYATEDLCQDTNGTPGIQTSTTNVALPWDQEECRAWHTPFAYTSQRPVAWGQGEWNYSTCSYDNELLWTAGRNGNATTADVVLMDGDDGTILDSVVIAGLVGDQYGIYGGAVDSEGNFWGTQLGGSRLIKVTLANMTSQVWTPPVASGYGMTVDVDGYVWICGSIVQRYNPATDTWAQSASGLGSSGCMADAGHNDLLWTAAGGTIRGINRETLLVDRSWTVPGSYGISIDFQGFVWAVAFGSSAHRVDPETGAVQSYDGLVGAYTYSDMTGAALSAVSGNIPTG
ncbi:MAG: hypothetical protein JKY37_21770 [Nannocystaceae bacterium]|nr:hypothetical protein [Nannocystaceae bacterium]